MLKDSHEARIELDGLGSHELHSIGSDAQSAFRSAKSALQSRNTSVVKTVFKRLENQIGGDGGRCVSAGEDEGRGAFKVLSCF